jgi:hypothetical protein
VRFWLGLAIGLVVGSGAMYLGLETPWRDAPAPAVAVAPEAGSGSATTAPGKKSRRGGKARRAPGDPASTEPMDVEETAPPVVLTAADKAMVWQGDAVKQPVKVLDMEDGTEVDPLSSSEVVDVARRQAQAALD